MDIIKTIVEKLKIKEIFAILFIAAIAVTFIPDELAVKLQIEQFRETYQSYISLCLIVIGSYYVLEIINWLKNWVWKKLYNEKRVALKYMKERMGSDEMQLLYVPQRGLS